MKLYEVVVQNILRCKFVRIVSKGEHVVLEGKNKQGKSSVLDAIEMIFAGGRSIPDKPKHSEANEKEKYRIIAKITPDKNRNEFIISRWWTEKGSYIEIKNTEGLSPSSPQAWLNKLIGGISFDPGSFLLKDSNEQAEILKNLVNLDFSDIERLYNKLYEDRKDVNSELKIYKGQLEEYKDVEKPGKFEGRSTQTIKKEIEKADEENSKIQNAINCIQGKKSANERIMKEIEILEEQIRNKKKEIEENQKIIEKTEPLAKKTPVSTEELYKELEAVSKTAVNQKNYEKRIEIAKKVSNLEEKKHNIQNEMKRFKAEKEQKIKDSKMPVKGLDVKDKKIYYNDLPFDQASQAEQIEITMAIAMALNPKLKIILIRNASLLDKESWEKIIKIANKNDFQLWMERVANKPSKQKNAFYIEDGGIKGMTDQFVDESGKEEEPAGEDDSQADLF